MENNNLIKLADDCYWDVNNKFLFVKNKEIKLSVSQKKIFKFLVENINKAVHSSDIFYEVHESLDKEYNEKSVRNFISGLRKVVPSLNIINTYGGYYTLKCDNLDSDFVFKEQFFEIIEQLKNPIVVTNPNEHDNPIIYVNSAFTNLFGYKHEEIVGKNCRLLHSKDKEQDALHKIREAIKEEKSIEINLRNYTKDGKLAYEDITISPIFDKQKEKLIYFLGIYKDVTLIQHLLEKLHRVI